MNNRLGTQLLMIVLALAVVLVGAAPGRVMAQSAKPEAANGAIMHVDEVNAADAHTIFTSPSASTAGAWRFSSSGSGGLAMAVECTGTTCTGSRAIGNKIGLLALSPALAVEGAASGEQGIGLLGHGQKMGVRGYQDGSNSSGYGGYFTATTGTGVSSSSIDGIALSAISDNNTGILGFGDEVGITGFSTRSESFGISVGVAGATNSTGNQARGVQGEAGNSDADSTASGVVGIAQGGLGSGVLGAAAKYGVRGFSVGTASYGGFFSSTAGIGLSATSVDNFALYGFSTNLYGITGGSKTQIGVRATSNSGVGLFVDSKTNIGAKLNTTAGLTALRATNSAAASPGKFGIISDGDVLVNGDLTCSGSCVQAVAASTSSGERLIYAETATTNRVSDEGSATLKNGRAVIEIDRLFADIAALGQGYQVFLTPGSSKTSGLAVENKGGTSFEVVELSGGKGDFSFDWRITAIRKGHEGVRLAPAPLAPAAEPLEDQFTK